MTTTARNTQTKKQWRSGGILFWLLPLALAGCGGGGGHFGNGTTLTGTVQSASGSPLAGYRVVYDQPSDLAPGQGANLTTTTNTQGQFTFQVPAGQITGSDLVYIYDATDSLVKTATVVPGGTPSVITVTPPTPPDPPTQTELPTQTATG